MLFRSRTRRTVLLSGLLIAVVITLKLAVPSIGCTVGDWISGVKENRVTAAIAGFTASLSDGQSFGDAVEVFHESWKNFTSD